MPERFVFEVFCQNEVKAIGELVLPAGKRVNVADVQQGFVPAERKYTLVEANGRLRSDPGGKPILRDGVQALCPLCAAPLLIREPGGDKGVFLVPGAFNTGNGK